MPVGHMTCFFFFFSFCLGCQVEWVLILKHSFNVTLACCLNPPTPPSPPPSCCSALAFTESGSRLWSSDGCVTSVPGDWAPWVVYFYSVQDGICINITR